MSIFSLLDKIMLVLCGIQPETVWVSLSLIADRE
ncbi:hypothetical protein T02_11329 [Trichinella nativa]|uniref:Uncharacterized protein n=1 Tax=Trichinella nativa TaxID=6335 RepID=A0A0V1JQY9_9BILA|nr:hypothetical protein T02_11329 [Trichinella nativa]